MFGRDQNKQLHKVVVSFWIILFVTLTELPGGVTMDFMTYGGANPQPPPPPPRDRHLLGDERPDCSSSFNIQDLCFYARLMSVSRHLLLFYLLQCRCINDSLSLLLVFIGKDKNI